jgi:Phage integrase, N-terminal SAM-like domain
MVSVFTAERAISPVDGSQAFVVVDQDYAMHAEASAYLAWLRSADRSPNTERVYAGRVALFLTYCAHNRLDWRALSLDDLARFLRALVTVPRHTHTLIIDVVRQSHIPVLWHGQRDHDVCLRVSAVLGDTRLGADAVRRKPFASEIPATRTAWL